jgi:4-amino-4-deoxy-L-arabinose transferase-like glycosyltransferase
MTDTHRLRAHHYILLALAALLMLNIGMARVPPLDRDESRYAEATAQMLESGNYVDVRFQDRPRYLQPAGIYWLESVSVSLFSSPGARQVWAYRIPSQISAVVTVLLTAWIGATLFGGAIGFAAALLLMMAVLVGVEARMATIDSTLLCAIMVAQCALLKIWLRRDEAAPARAPAARCGRRWAWG